MPQNVANAAPEEAGAPDMLTLREMAGPRRPVVIPDPAVPPAMEDAFRDWWSRNAYALEDGGCGDVVELLRVLEAARPKA